MPVRPDYCSKDGAHKLAKKIEEYWRAKGSKQIDTWVEPGARVSGSESTSANVRFDVRTNMVNGLPPDMTSLPDNNT